MLNTSEIKSYVLSISIQLKQICFKTKIIESAAKMYCQFLTMPPAIPELQRLQISTQSTKVCSLHH